MGRTEGDRHTGRTRRITDGNNGSGSPAISGAGRFVAFSSQATNLVPHDGFGQVVFVWDRRTGDVRRITAGKSRSVSPSISGDGRHVVYNAGGDVHVWDRTSGTTTLLTLDLLHARSPAISGDGQHVIFHSGDLDPINGPELLYLWDRRPSTPAEPLPSGGG